MSFCPGLSPELLAPIIVPTASQLSHRHLQWKTPNTELPAFPSNSLSPDFLTSVNGASSYLEPVGCLTYPFTSI